MSYCLDVLDSSSGMVVDPFAGVGTTGTAAIRRGHAFRGIEAHPLVASIASLKFTRLSASRAAAIHLFASESVDRVKRRDRLDAKFDNETRLVTQCFDITTLRVLIGLRDEITAAPDEVRPYLRVALVGLLREVASVKVGWPHQRPALKRVAQHGSVTDRFLTRVRWLVDDLTAAPKGDGRVIAGDSRKSAAWRRALAGRQPIACLSSPPYLNNFDYADATRLELYFLGMATTWAEMCQLARDGMIAASTQQTTQRLAEAAWDRLRSFPTILEAAENLAKPLRQSRRQRPRGKEYDQLLPAYLADLSDVLVNVFRNLQTSGQLIWVVGDSAPYGVYVDTPQLIARLAQEIGFEPLTDLVLRQRGKRWAQNGRRHHVSLSERLVVLRKPG